MWIYIILSVSSFDVIADTDDTSTENDKDECALSSGDLAAQRVEPLGSVNGKSEADDKENNGISTDETQAVRYDWAVDTETVHIIVKLLEIV